MFTEQRRRAVMSLLAARRAVSVRELAEATRSSEVTVRRDLAALEAQGLLSRRRGGAVIKGGAVHEPTHVEKAMVASEEKAAIARRAAAELVRDGDVLLIGAGTTTQAFARALRSMQLSVVTNSVLVADELAGAVDVEVFVTGGTLRGPIRALVGGHAEQAVAGLRVPTVFLSGNGLTVERGLSTPNMLVASIDRAMVAAAAQVVVLADHTKLGVDTMVQTVPLAGIRTVVTDALSPPAEVARLRSAGVRVLVAEL